ncbi:SDR family oxidoreductase [Actinospica sp.]|uniref:SDR family oxidoreductase n=1 Tax=Actinospica sp. TaxID=1872142 RepID=UPI002CA8905A|nr:SDR family oxidoreductase [Actinospica sp.]HWG27164.1 SDR family oxidoreductase [Actinospica sp.]
MATLAGALAPLPARWPLPDGLRGCTVVIVGGSSGIGLAAGALLHDVGAEIVLVGRDLGRLDAAVKRIAGDGPEVVAVSADSGDEQALTHIFKEFGAIDHILVTAGGLEGTGPVGTLTPEAVRSTLDARVWGALAAARVAAPRLPAGGSITLTSGIYATRPVPGMAAPLAALGAVEALTGALAVEFAPFRVRVNTVRYGSVDTPLMRGAAGISTDKAAAEAGAAMLLGRFATPAEAAATAVFLMANTYVNGQIITVDGGQSLV